MISKFEAIFFNLNSILESLKEEPTSLVNENLCISSTIEENVDIVGCGNCPILKLEIKNLKWKLTHNIKSPSVVSSDSSAKRQNFRKYFKENAYSTKKIERTDLLKSFVIIVVIRVILDFYVTLGT